MRRNLLPAYCFIIVSAILFFGCTKDIYDTPCRLQYWQGLDDDYLRTLHYNQWGLLDKWTEHQPDFNYEVSFTVEYDKYRKVSLIKYYDHGIFYFTIVPEYKYGRIAKEKYYFTDKSLADIIDVTYNSKGQIIKKASVANYYHITFQYDQYGNVTNNKVIDELTNSIILNERFKYNTAVREPMTTVTGMPYPIPFSNYLISPLIWSDYDAEGYDQFGNAAKLYDFDPSQSTLKSGKDHLAVYRDAFDRVSGQHNRKLWKYENCNCGGDVKLSEMAKAFTSKASVKSTPPQFMTVIQVKAMVLKSRKKK